MQPTIFGIIGGLGMFLFGMKAMSDGLQNVAGAKLRKTLDLLTKNVFLGVGVGAFVTSIIQSSSAMTVMTVGFVNAGLITLKQAISVILGANIGTTITAQLIAFNITQYALPAIGIGVAMIFFGRTRHIKNWGYVVFGFGLLFYGMHTMKHAVGFLKSSQLFKDIFVSFSKTPITGIIAGAVLTMILQSSSATVGLTLVLAHTGLIDFVGAFALVLGENIGTTITAILASIGTNISAKRTALAHFIFNVFGTIYMYLLLFVRIDDKPIFLYFIDMITPGKVFIDGSNITRHVANSHSIFNIFNCVLFMPLIGLLQKSVVKFIPGNVKTIQAGTRHLDPRIANTPSIALDQVRKEVIHMAEVTREMTQETINNLTGPKTSSDRFQEIMRMEDHTDELQREIVSFIVKLDQERLSEEMAQTSARLMNLANDLERIGDHCEKMIRLYEEFKSEKNKLNKEDLVELKNMADQVDQMFALSIESVKENDVTKAKNALKLEAEIDRMEDELRHTNMIRLTKTKVGGTAVAIFFAEIISNLERIGDHAAKMSKLIIRENTGQDINL